MVPAMNSSFMVPAKGSSASRVSAMALFTKITLFDILFAGHRAAPVRKGDEIKVPNSHFLRLNIFILIEFTNCLIR